MTPREPLDTTTELTGTTRQQAASLVVHGLLESRARADPAARDARVRRVMAELESRPDPDAVLPNRWRLPRMFGGLAAAVVLGVLAIQLGRPTERSALVDVQLSIAAMKNAGAQRYEVRVLPWTTDATDDVPDVIDTMPPAAVVVRHQPPWEAEPLACGRDAAGFWAIARDGSVVRGHEARRLWPPWASIEGEIVLGQSVDGLLLAMVAAYELQAAPAEKLDRPGDTHVMDHVVATRLAERGHQPNRIDVWIDPATRVVERIVYSWSKEERDPPRRPGPGGPAGGPAGPGGHEPPPHGPPPHHGGGPDGRHRPPPPDGGLGGPGGGPGGPGGPEGRGGPRGRPPPGNPRTITFERVTAPALAPGWFEARTHATK